MSNKVHTCSKCNSGFNDEKYLKRHLNKNIPCDKVHTCAKCNKEFASAQNLRKHNLRKTTCVPTEVPVLNPANTENKCKFCGKSYSSIYSLKRHMGTCHMKDNQGAMFQILVEQNQQMMEQIKTLQQQVQPIHQTLNQTVNNVVNNNLYVNVTICSFGNEALDRLDTESVLKLVKNHTKDFIPKMIEHIHANPNHPEFHNVFYDPVREKALVFAPISDTEVTWQMRELGEVSAAITQKIKEHMQPTNGPYFNHSMGEKDSDTANAIIQIANADWGTPEVLEGTKIALTKVTENEGFLEQVSVLE
jgi:uncharacterized phage infection (PIP) family protein YhgE